LFDPTLVCLVCLLQQGTYSSNKLERQLYKTRQDKSKNQSGISIKKLQAGNNFIQPMSGLIDIKPNCIIAGEARNSLNLGSTSASLN
jgi:hypothetical protein